MIMRTCPTQQAPTLLPRPTCVDVAIERRTASDTWPQGGDLDDIYQDPDGSACVLLADLSSKGSRSIGHVRQLRDAFRRAARMERIPSRIMAALNRLHFGSAADGQQDVFATAFIARIAPAANTLCYASGGHDTAMVISGRAHRHLAQTGPVIGVISRATYADRFVDFAAGDLLLVATDGFTECRRDRAPSEQFGTSGIVRALGFQEHHTPHRACTVIGKLTDSFTGGAYRDDATLVALTRRS